jgi:cytochrome b
MHRAIIVWDLPTRVFHWSLVLLVAMSYTTAKLNLMHYHAVIGEATLSLIIFRLLWGAYGSETARFRSFLTGPKRVIFHLRRLFQFSSQPLLGHTSAGGWAVLMMLMLLLCSTLSGLFINNDVVRVGPLTPRFSALIANAAAPFHALLFDALAAMVTLHVIAVVAYAVVKKQDLVTPMISGRKLVPPCTPPRLAPIALALVSMVLSIVAAALLSFFV